jgi:hypothetical protein
MNETQVCSAVAMKDGHGVRQTLVNIARNFAVRTALASFRLKRKKRQQQHFPGQLATYVVSTFSKGFACRDSGG